MTSQGPRPQAQGPKKAQSPLITLCLVCVVLCASCGDPDPPGEGPGPGEVRYTLAWDTDRVVDAEVGWAVENDRGYFIEVSGAYLVNFSMELVECEPDPSILGAIWSWLDPISTAWAGHPGDDPNPASINASRAEDMLLLEESVAGVTSPGADRYCMAHYLVARSDEFTEGLPEDIALEGLSLFLGGVWSKDGRRESFIIETSLAAGMLHEIYPVGGFGQEALAFEADTGVGGVEVRITRDPASLFDEVDFETMSVRDMERQALRNLIATTIIEVSPAQGGM